jgi:hypothetical protein
MERSDGSKIMYRQRPVGVGRRRAPADQAGSLTAFVAVFCVALFALIGLVVDSGRAIATRSATMAEAQQAARAGAGQLSADSLRSGQVQIDPEQAVRAVKDYLSETGQTGTTSVQVVGQTVTVHIAFEEPTVILGIVGIDHIQVAVTASAVNVHGVTEAD